MLIRLKTGKRQDDTAVIQTAIDRCHAAGGGEVRLLSGTFVSGTLYLRSNVRLHIEAGAILRASPRIADYGTNTHYNRYVNETAMDRCFIYAEDAENIALGGDGMIDGNAEAFPNAGDIHRPMMIRMLRCRNVHLESLCLYNAAAWTTAILDSMNIWCCGLDICNEKRYNGDGLDFDGSRNIYITDCKIVGTDDNLCLQSSSVNYPMRNVHITNCEFTSLCAGIRIGLKSLGEIADVVISNCTFVNVWREGIKIECTEGGTIRNIVANGIVMRNVSRPVFIILNNRLAAVGSSIGLNEMPEIGVMSDIAINNLTIYDEPEEMRKTHRRFVDDIMGSPLFHGIRVDAEDNHKIDGLTLSNIIYRAVGSVKREMMPDIPYPPLLDLQKHPDVPSAENYWPDWSRTACMDIRNTRNLILDNIRLKTEFPDEREWYRLENCDCLKENIFVEK